MDGSGFPDVTPDARSAQARAATSDAVATLHRLNAERILAWAEGDVAWFRAHLSEEFVAVLADGRRVDKAAYLELVGETAYADDASFQEVDVHPLGDVALLRGVGRYWYGDSDVSMRYTDVWRQRDGWVIVGAHFTPLASVMSDTREERETSIPRRGLRAVLR